MSNHEESLIKSTHIEDLVSIIVAVYNVEPYLRKCLDSLINQTYENIEIICVDDCSTDGCRNILKQYAASDKRIKVICNSCNGGLAVVRNKALKSASGTYLMYCDGDDWLEVNACETLINVMKTYQPQVVMFTYIREYKNRSLKKDIFSEKMLIFNEDECEILHRRHAGIIGEELNKPQNADSLCSLCTKMYLTDIMLKNKIEYIDNKIIGTYGDGLVNLNYYGYVTKAVYINEYLYHYRKTNLNSQTTRYKKEFPTQWNNLYDIIKEYIDRHKLGRDYYIGLNNRIALGIIGLGMNALHSQKTIVEKILDVRAILTEERYHEAVKNLDISYMEFHWKIFFMLCKLKFSIGVSVLLKIMLILKQHI